MDATASKETSSSRSPRAVWSLVAVVLPLALLAGMASPEGELLAFTSMASGQISGARHGEPNVLMRFLGGA